MEKEIGRLSTVREVNNMQLVKKERFVGNEVDLYKDAKGNIYMTIDQLAKALDYASKSAIENMFMRHEYLMGEEFSSTHVVWVDGKSRGTRLLTEDGIYEVTMLSRQPKAREFRFFIRELLKGLRKGELQITQKPSYQIDDPIERAKRWIEEEEKRQRLQIENEQMKPKAQFAEAVEISTNSVSVSHVAKIARKEGLDIGQNKLFAWLRDNGYLVKRTGATKNTPTQRSMDLGVMELVASTKDFNGDSKTFYTTKITGKGQIYFVNKLLKEYGQ